LGVAWLIQISPLVCAAHLICFDPSVLDSIMQTVDNIVYFGLSLISAAVFLFGLCRKIWLNRFSAYPLPPANLPQ
jgi:hypothetical protein